MDTHDSSTSLVIADVLIMQDEYGRYNLNTLHLASGADTSKKPGNWIKRKSTQALISELDSQVSFLTLDVVHGGERSGTYGHELLAVSYAGWISPAFQLRVNQAFIDTRTGGMSTAIQLPKELTHFFTQVGQALAQTAQMMQLGFAHVNARLETQDTALMHVSQRLEQLEAAVDNRPGYMTLMGFARLKKFRLPLAEARRHGLHLCKKARDAAVALGEAPDERWGKVNTYPVELLEEYFAALLEAKSLLDNERA